MERRLTLSSASVVIPCDNYDALAGVLGEQHGVDVRVLIIRDAPMDDSTQAHSPAAHDPRIEFVFHGSNQGHVSEYNQGLRRWADVENSVFMLADDRLTPGTLPRATELFHSHLGPDSRTRKSNRLAMIPHSHQHGESHEAGRSGQGAHSWGPQFQDLQNSMNSQEVVVRTSPQLRVGDYASDSRVWLTRRHGSASQSTETRGATSSRVRLDAAVLEMSRRGGRTWRSPP